MGERRGTKALELWCRRITDGYPGVKIDNMTTSWRNGLGFCAMIHHFRPDLIEFEKLNKNDIYYNNDLAFRTAEINLGIPALLDAADMEAYEVPDRLSILTYLSQFYQVFAGQDSTNRLKRMSSNAEKNSISKTPGPPPKMAHIVGVPKREPCKKCSLPIFLAERVNVGKQVYHRTCLKCARCNSQLSIGNFYETEVDGEFCCETCPDEETNFTSTLSTATSSNIVKDENESYNNIVGGYRNSIADRLTFFERNGKNDSSLLQKSLTDEEKRKSLEKIAAQYKPNLALSSFMNTTLGESPNHTSNLKIKPNVNKSSHNTTSESSDEDNEEISIENKPPALPKDGPPIEYIDDVDEDDVLSVTIESNNTAANNNATINQNEQTANNNATNYVSNSKVLLSLSNKNIKSNLTQNHNHYNTDNNINNNDLNLSTNVTKDISNIKNYDIQTGNEVNIESKSTTPKSIEDIFTDLNSITSQYVELRNTTESPLKSNKENNSKLTNYMSNNKVDLTEQRLSVVRTRLQQFEEVLKSGGGINNSTKSTISISSSNNLSNIENSKLDDKPIENTVPQVNKSDVINIIANKESEQRTKEVSITEELENNSKQNELEKMVLNVEDQSTNEKDTSLNEVKDEEEKIEILSDQVDGEEEINIEEQIKLSDDIKQVENIKEDVREEVEKTKIENTELIAETNLELTLKNENIENVKIEIDEIQEKDEKEKKNNIPCEDKIKNSQFDVNIKQNIEKKLFDTMVVDVSEQSTVKDIIPNSKLLQENLKNNEEIDYPEELNPFASDDEDEDHQIVNTTNKSSIIRKKEQNNTKSSEFNDRRKSLNPFDSCDEDDNSSNHNTENNREFKLKPPRPPPPKISKNPFDSESEEEENIHIPYSGNTSIISTDSNKRVPVPTPRSQLTPSGKNNLTPEATPRPSRQNYSANNRTEYYGSNISLNASITSPTGHDSFSRHNDTRSSNNSLASSAGGSSGVNTMRSKKKKAPAPPAPPTMITGESVVKVSKELFPANDVESKKSTPTSSSATTPQMSRKKRPAPKPPTPVNTNFMKNTESTSNTSTVAGASSLLTKTKNISSSKDNLLDALNQVEIEKLSDEEKAAHRDNRQFFLEATSTSSKVSEIYKKEDTSLKEISTDKTPSMESSQIINQKTGGVECSETITDKSLTINADNLVLNTNQSIVTSTPEECYKSETIIHSFTNNDILVEASADEMQHDRHIEKIKDNKESKNRNRQSQPYNEDIQNETTPLYNKSTHGKWKRRKGPAPLLPVPPRKILQMLPLQEIRHELEIIEVQQQGLEKQGVVLETMIRERCEGKNGELINGCGDPNEKQTNTKEVEDLILQLFELVNEKNDLFRRQAELMYLRRQHRLEQEQADLEYEIRVLMAQPEKNKTDSDKAREEALITRLVEVVQLRNEVIECLDMDRLREAEEDLSIKQRLEMHTAKRDEELCKQTPTKLSKKEKKKQKELKKLGKSKQIDADKDADESEINVEVQKKKKRKFLFNVLTSSSK